MSAPGPALALHQMPGHLVRRLQQVAVRLFAERVGEDLTPVQYAALAAAARHPGLDQVSLGNLIGYDRTTIGGVIDRLESKGWVERSAAAGDRRLKLVGLTAAGRAVLQRATAQVEQVQAHLVEPLSDAERRQFERLCLKLLAHHAG